MPSRIVIFRPGALGDLLLALPAVRQVRKRFPEAEIHVAGNVAFLPALSLSPDVSGTLDFGSADLVGLFTDEGEPPRELLGSYELAILWMRDPGGLVRKQLGACGIPRVVGGDPGPRSPSMHVARQLWALLPELGLAEPDLAAAHLKPAGQSAAAGRAVLHPGSGGQGKLWEMDGFVHVGKRLLAEGLPVRLLEGPADGDRGQRLLDRLPGADLVRPPDVLALASQLSGAAVVLGNDSGPGHLAAALGSPVVSVFGPTDPALWSPCGPRVLTLGGSGRWPSERDVMSGTLRAVGRWT